MGMKRYPQLYGSLDVREMRLGSGKRVSLSLSQYGQDGGILHCGVLELKVFWIANEVERRRFRIFKRCSWITAGRETSRQKADVYIWLEAVGFG